MRLDDAECWDRLRRSRHGVLGTVHAARGVDAVPVVFVVHDRDIVVPIDTVKSKSGARLQRLRNLERDARAVLLVDHYEDDWTQLWWVRAHGAARESTPTADQRDRLAAAFPAYAPPGAVASVICLTVEALTGWAAR